ncbi:hypothetical protein ACFQY7_51930 [Actinomadura luteofluorescens]|uniref:hypothetical protein n=1 Tax=Actinomadura luteofluorescens TaxID=46163 RepID=UPI00362972BA
MRLSLRARLTLTYGGLFLAAGVVLLGATYALFDQQLSRSGPKVLATRLTPAPGTAPPPGSRRRRRRRG